MRLPLFLLVNTVALHFRPTRAGGIGSVTFENLVLKYQLQQLAITNIGHLHLIRHAVLKSDGSSCTAFLTQFVGIHKSLLRL
ncbi:MAG: hypothetical protein ACI9XC_001889 [Gammaproteobacteria bacterium]|jgi:hypothetical protein